MELFGSFWMMRESAPFAHARVARVAESPSNEGTPVEACGSADCALAYRLEAARDSWALAFNVAAALPRVRSFPKLHQLSVCVYQLDQAAFPHNSRQVC
eukprot:403760-Rhodomonas_salina.1